MAFKLGSFLVFLFLTATVSFAQSLDVGAPAPVRSSSASGKIVARDLGDSRLTDHYFRFTGTPGDLLITVQSTNLNGDLDVFTAVTLRPLLKLTLYAESTAPVTKGIYLRKREDLILRIEARTPNDDPGTYKLYFGGSFEAIPGGPDIAEAEATETEPGAQPVVTGPKTRRVTSAGARIEEPAPPVTEVAAAPTPTPEPTPEAKPVESPKTTEKRAEPETARTTPTRNTRGRRPPARRQPTPPKEEPAPKETPTVEESKPTTTERRAASNRRTATEPPAAKPEPEPEVGPRLIIETNDGTLINRSMSGVRRVTIENGQVVVTGKDGKINRILLANVVRMQIQP
ncbi:MAG TPA: hypothetical protein VJS17_06925 [Pyrinomonadaceae bacterium]|nr:hypothetical protein [Pyrinomonadaceae bacterium]